MKKNLSYDEFIRLYSEGTGIREEILRIGHDGIPGKIVEKEKK